MGIAKEDLIGGQGGGNDAKKFLPKAFAPQLLPAGFSRRDYGGSPYISGVACFNFDAVIERRAW